MPDKLPLIVISHGRTGWAGGHRDTAAFLADAGFVVAAINHPIDGSTGGMSRVDDLAYLTERPADIKRLIDFMTREWPFASHIDPARVGFFGFSRGGYTGLVLAGGDPNPALARASCGPRSAGNLCIRILNNEFPAAGYVHDPRIKAAVLADPAPNFFFGPQDLKNVTIPIQLWSSEHGGFGASVARSEAIRDALLPKPDFRIVPKAAHYIFLTPCSAGQAIRNAEICVDAPDVDRVRFHAEFNAAARDFFRDHLNAAMKR